MTDGPEMGPQPLSDNRVFSLTPIERGQIALGLKLLRIRIDRQNALVRIGEIRGYEHQWDPAQIRALMERFRG